MVTCLVYPLLLVQFAEISEEGRQVNVNDVSWFPDDEVARCGEPKAMVFLERNGERVLVVGAIEVVLVLTCDRCLEEFTSPLKVDVRLLLEVAEAGESCTEPQNIDYEYCPDELEVVTLDGPVVDLGDLLYQQLLLALPQKVLCRSDCLGICSRCGVNLNSKRCDCSDSPGSTSFAALGRLLKNTK